MINVKYQLRNVKEIREQNRCGAISFYCPNEECEYIYPKEDRETLDCPECGTPRRVCGKYNAKGRNRCNRHGGGALVGIDHPSYEGKGTSKNLPTRLLEFYQLSLMENPDGRILEMEDDIHLLETRKQDLISQLSREGADALWTDARKAYEKFSSARKRAASGSTKAAEQMGESLDELESILVKGYAQGAIWGQLLEVIAAQTRLKESEMKRREKASTIVTEEHVAALIGGILSDIKTRVTDQDVRAALLNDIKARLAVK
jgi:hypothetical protein